jgi:hypothetical protein
MSEFNAFSFATALGMQIVQHARRQENEKERNVLLWSSMLCSVFARGG